tara:strand:- start:10472 stop:10669 length:198 start_codon:yes stop_codon:yes gene_type:complete
MAVIHHPAIGHSEVLFYGSYIATQHRLRALVQIDDTRGGMNHQGKWDESPTPPLPDHCPLTIGPT